MAILLSHLQQHLWTPSLDWKMMAALKTVITPAEGHRLHNLRFICVLHHAGCLHSHRYACCRWRIRHSRYADTFSCCRWTTIGYHCHFEWFEECVWWMRGEFNKPFQNFSYEDICIVSLFVVSRELRLPNILLNHVKFQQLLECPNPIVLCLHSSLIIIIIY